jgi:hypothetical protein
LEENDQIKILQAAMGQKISQLARKYSIEFVSKAWEEIKTTDGDLAFFSVSGWKREMTLMEALECLDDYCDFIEAMVRKRQEEKGQIHYIPALFN